MKLIIDNDPDNEGFYSIFTDEPATINVELAGKIGERSVAELICRVLEAWEPEQLG